MSEKLAVLRTENKFIISVEKGLNIQNKLNKILQLDEYSKNGFYMVRSLYFDSINNKDFQTKLAGTEIRKKIRLRIYDVNAKRCKLEMKKKNDDLQYKVSLWITKAEAKSLINRNFSVLKKYFSTIPESIEIYSTLCLGCYKPVVLIEYNRLAYIHKLNNTRITFDSNIRSTESNFDLFAKKPLYNVINNENIILEVKYNEKLINLIADIINPYHLTKESASKYCLGRKIYQDFEY